MTNPSLTLLNGVAQGTGENARVGRLCKMNWLDINVTIYAAQGFLGASSVRSFIVAETTALGSALAPSQFFVDTTNFTPNSQRDRTNRNASRYVVLWDSGPKVIGGLSVASGQTAPVNPGAGQPCVQNFSIHLPLNFFTDYSRGSAGTVADIDTNSLYLMIVSDTGTANNLAATGGFTTCFSDDQ